MQQKQAEPKAIDRSLQVNQEYLKETLGIGKSFDIVAKEFHFDGHKVVCYCVNGFFMTNSNVLIVRSIAEEVVKFAQNTPSFEPDDLIAYLNTHVEFVQVSLVKNMDDALVQILSGPMVLFAEGYPVAVALDTRVYPARNPSEPEIERVVRGPRDGFTETLLTNTALTRRRLRDPNLRMEILQVGRRSKTDVCLAYIEDITNIEFVKQVKDKLESIQVDGIPMAEQSLEEYLVGSRWNPYPLVRYTERPDVAAVSLLQGHLLIFVDTSPEVIIAPTTIFQHLHHPEDYHLRPAVGTYMRWAILLAILASIFLPPVWLMFAMNRDWLPGWLSFLVPKDINRQVSLPCQLLFAELGIDIFRRAVVNTPLPLASAIGIVSGIVFGQFTVKIGLMSPEALVYIAIATVAAFATSSPELAQANKLARIFLLLMVGILNWYGLAIGTLIWFIVLGKTRTFGIPYLYPLIPFNWRGLKRILIREPVGSEMTRPEILNPQDQSKK